MKCEHGVYIPEPINLRSAKERKDGTTKQLVEEYSLAQMKQWTTQPSQACSVCSGCDTTSLKEIVWGGLLSVEHISGTTKPSLTRFKKDRPAARPLEKVNCQCVGCRLDRAEARGEHQQPFEERQTQVSSPVGSSQNLLKRQVLAAPKWTVGRAMNHAVSLQEWDDDKEKAAVENNLIARLDGTRDEDIYPNLRDSLEYQLSELEIAPSAAKKIEGFILWEVQRVLSNRNKYDGTMSDTACAALMRRHWRRRKWQYPQPHPVLTFYPSERPDSIPAAITKFLRNMTPAQFTRLRQQAEDRAAIVAREQTFALWDAAAQQLRHLLHRPESREEKFARLGNPDDKKFATSAR